MNFEEWYTEDENEDWFANEAGTERDIAKYAWDAATDEAIKIINANLESRKIAAMYDNNNSGTTIMIVVILLTIIGLSW